MSTSDTKGPSTSAAGSPLLEVEHLVMEFPISGRREVVHAVNEVSFTLGRGETLGLVGESGSGKTTVGRLLLGLLRATGGSVRFDQSDTTTLSAKAMRALRPRMQMVFQDPFESLNPRLSVSDNIRIPARNAGQSADEQSQRVRELSDLVRLDRRLLDSYPNELSGGQQQRVGIARALATRPDLIVLDEPVSNLDPTVRADIIDLLVSVQAETNVSYVFISHDLTTVEFVSHRVVIMYLGEIVEVGATDEIFAGQAHPYSVALLSSVLYPDPDRIQPRFPLFGEIPSPINLPTGCYLASRCPLATARCLAEHPVLVEVAPGRLARCHYPGEAATFVPRPDNLRRVDALRAELATAVQLSPANTSVNEGAVNV